MQEITVHTEVKGRLKQHIFFHVCHPGVFLLTHIISLLSVIHTIYSIMQTKIQWLHVSTVYGHLQALFLN